MTDRFLSFPMNNLFFRRNTTEKFFPQNDRILTGITLRSFSTLGLGASSGRASLGQHGLGPSS